MLPPLPALAPALELRADPPVPPEMVTSPPMEIWPPPEVMLMDPPLAPPEPPMELTPLEIETLPAVLVSVTLPPAPQRNWLSVMKREGFW